MTPDELLRRLHREERERQPQGAAGLHGGAAADDRAEVKLSLLLKMTQHERIIGLDFPLSSSTPCSIGFL